MDAAVLAFCAEGGGGPEQGLAVCDGCPALGGGVAAEGGAAALSIATLVPCGDGDVVPCVARGEEAARGGGAGTGGTRWMRKDSR
eukprot:9221994-Alexandrium_andersonii.AAC.1